MEENKYWNPIIETLPRERLVEIELKRFRETLGWAKESSPFYPPTQKTTGFARGAPYILWGTFDFN